MLRPGAVALAVLPLGLLYTMLAAMGGLALLRLAVLERWQDWRGPARLLILAPHEDDCVISAGGVGAHNSRIGGATRIVYLAPDEAPGMAERRAGEARAAWRVARWQDRPPTVSGTPSSPRGGGLASSPRHQAEEGITYEAVFD